MTPYEFKQARNILQLSCAALSRAWGMGPNGDRTIRRWESGEVPVNPIAAYCIRLMVEMARHD
ncbi:MAG: hypothetical protein PF483_11680 [Halothiobacillus sp.]|jgi:DNA-binding transcriptional regulator YiaG|nr:hypothetical protein [Halothiobacillus sp.]